MPLDATWNILKPHCHLELPWLCSPLSSGEIRSSRRNACICSGSKWSKWSKWSKSLRSLRSPCRRQCWHRWHRHRRHCRAGPLRPLRPLGRLQRRRPGRPGRSSRRHGPKSHILRQSNTSTSMTFYNINININIYKIIGNIILYYIMTITSHVRTIPAKLLGAFLNQTSVRSKDASWLSRISTLIISRPFVERSTLPVRMGCTRCMSFLPLTFAASQCQEWRSYSFSKEFWNFQQFDVFTLAPFGSISLQVTALQHFARPPVRTVASQVRPLTRTIPWLIHAALFLLKAVFSNVYYIFL